MDTEQWKKKIEAEISSIEKQIEELTDAISQLEDYKAIFRETHRSIVAAEEKAGELNLLFELNSQLKPLAQLGRSEEAKIDSGQEEESAESASPDAETSAGVEAQSDPDVAAIDPELQSRQLIPNFLRQRLRPG